eukprot:1048973-Prymnesium_polylepis.1
MWEREARLSPNSARMPGVGSSVRIVLLLFLFFGRGREGLPRFVSSSSSGSTASSSPGSLCSGLSSHSS